LILRKKPVVVVSRCLGFGVCRWNGAALACRLVDELKNEVEFIPVCPECETGLGMPRSPIRLVQKDSGLALIQPETGLDLTCEMVGFAEKFLQSLKQVDGFLLKRKSPSCGLVGIPVYAAPEAEIPIHQNGVGFFAAAAGKYLSDIPKVDEECPDPESFLELLK
jgi:uncharacterized protein YbbK (DUF523 family)